VIPEGMRDVLPPEAAELRAIEHVVLGRFNAYGYGEVRPPALEYPETMESAGVDLLASGFHLYDERGRALVLRTDLTTAVARLAVDRLRDRRLPLRLAYAGPVYRTEASRNGREGEFTQLGAELLGSAAAAADAEAVVLLCDALAATGLRGHRLAIGSVAFHRELVAALGLAPADSADVFAALADRDYARLETIVSRRGVDDEGRKTLQRALDLSPGKGALAAARKLASSEGMEEVVERLVSVQELADDAGYGDLVGFDFGLMPDIDYYTGIVIEAYAPGVDFPVASGGRYDRLLAAFDWPMPAVGFTIDLDRLHQALVDEGAGVTPVFPPALAFAGGLDDPRRVVELRRLGVAVAALPAEAEPAQPRLRVEHGEFILETRTGTTRGQWRDVLRALGVG
jgi:ATP phosphoribosyltransferase regulatory subunit